MSHTGAFAVNPFTGERIPIFLANYVLMEYGTGAIMAVPAHDARDHEFAVKYGLPIPEVIVPKEGAPAGKPGELFEDLGVLVNSGPFTGLTSEEATDKMAALAKDKGFGREGRHLPPARLGHLAAALLGHAHPDDPLP